MTLRLRQWACLFLFLTATTVNQETLAQTTVAVDSVVFVTASILVVSPGKEAYSSVGHCALRMECPSHNLDFCFTYETDINEDLYLRFLTGKTQGGLFVVPTERYLSDHLNEGRGITSYSLNLSLEEKRELWRSLDEELPLGLHKPFDFFRRNCTSMIYEKVLSIMRDEQIIANDYQIGRADNRRFYQKAEADAPWTFFFGLLLANYVAPDIHIVNRLYPISLPDWLQRAVIVSDKGETRKVLQEAPKVLFASRLDMSPTQITPIVVFLLLLVWTVIMGLCEFRGIAGKIVHVTDVMIFTIYTLVALLLLYVMVIDLFGERWNWMLIPFNLLPPLLWLFARNKPWHHYVWLFYMIVLAAFAVFYPLYTGFLHWPFLLIFISLFIRCLCKYKIHHVQAR